MAIIDGSIGDAPTNARLNDPETAAGVALYGYRDQLGDVILAIRTESLAIGSGTTIWLDTDLDRSTGHQIFGFTGGAEYNVQVDADGIARLYSGGAGETFVTDLEYAYSEDGLSLEIRVPGTTVGTEGQLRVYADVNDSVFVPASYDSTDLIVGDPVRPAPIAVDDKLLDGDLSDWSADTRLDTPVTGTAGAAFYGERGETAFTFALTLDSGRIGAGTTIWLDTDTNRATGHQIFGFTGGAEYNINFAADGTAALYTGGGGETFVSRIDYRLSDDGQTVEFAVDRALLDGTERLRAYADINDDVFLPSSYDSGNYFVGDVVRPDPVDAPGLRVGIVYSENSAANFFSETAYGQLFMSAQSQAMQAGIPFDVLGEADLLSTEGLEQYDLLVFPGLSNVRADQLARITQTLEELQYKYGTGFVTAGNFLTNDETGTAFAGDSYARMKSLLGVTLQGFGATEGIEVTAAAGDNPILDGYSAGASVGSFSNISYLKFADVTGTGETLFNATVTPPGGKSLSFGAVIATETNGRNVHFAGDAFLGNTNILQSAIDWIAADREPDVSLSMTRGESLFMSRNDMDYSAQYTAVALTEPGIYDEMLPILEGYYEEFGFVGSYYLNVGANSPDEQTDWSVSKPYYERLMEMENEIGSHSYTHPDNTNGLVGDTPEILALAARVDPRNPDAVDPESLTPDEQALLYSSFRFQFETSKLILSAELGIEITGAAVPGMPETIDTTRQIIPYYDYLSGGYSAAGAGYPGAFGYLSDNETEQVYIAPNMSFDFTLVGFQGMTAQQAEAAWIAEYDEISANADMPIHVFPWHDYGLTNWEDSDPSTNYSEAMFRSVIERAYNDGAEFVTGRDLAQRIDSFSKSELTAVRTDAGLSVTVASDDAGRFALDLSEEGRIAGVEGWYAWTDTEILLPTKGGTFDVRLGNTPDDVTRLTALPQRAELISASGNGRDLSFALEGRGTATVLLGAAAGFAVSGSDGARAVSADAVELQLDTVSRHEIDVKGFAAGAAITAAAGGSILIGGAGGQTLQGAAGDDILWGGAGADTFALRAGGSDVIRDFTVGEDRLVLSDFGFIYASRALMDIEDRTDGAFVSDGTGGGVLLAGVSANDLNYGDIATDGPTPDRIVADNSRINDLNPASGGTFIVIGDGVSVDNTIRFYNGTNTLIIGDSYSQSGGEIDFYSADGDSTLIIGDNARMTYTDIDMDAGGYTNTFIIGANGQVDDIDLGGSGYGIERIISIGENTLVRDPIMVDVYGRSGSQAKVELTLKDGVTVDGSINGYGSRTDATLRFGDGVTVNDDMRFNASYSSNDVIIGNGFTLNDNYYGANGTDRVEIGRDWNIDGPVYLNGGNDTLMLGATGRARNVTFDGGSGTDRLVLELGADRVDSFEFSASRAGWTETSDGVWSTNGRTLYGFDEMTFQNFERVAIVEADAGTGYVEPTEGSSSTLLGTTFGLLGSLDSFLFG